MATPATAKPVATLGATLPALTRIFPKLPKKPGLDFSAVVPVAIDVALVAPAISSSFPANVSPSFSSISPLSNIPKPFFIDVKVPEIEANKSICFFSLSSFSLAFLSAL